MPKVELTDKFCGRAKATDGRRKTDYFDVATRGLCLRATSGGGRTWFAVYGPPAKRQWLKLGSYPETGLAKARQKARDARAAVGDGKDPVADKKALAAGDTVADMVESYIARHASTKRSGDQIARMLRKDVSGIIGDIKLAGLHRRDLTKCIDTVADRGAKVTAVRLFANMRAMVRWAKGRGDLDSNLMEGMTRATDETERERFLSDGEIRSMWRTLADADMRESTRRILRLCLVTGQRVGEVAGMTRAELNLEGDAVWTIPAERVKNGREHKVPLSSMAVEIIGLQIADADALAKRKKRKAPAWIFPAPGGRAAVTRAAVSRAVARCDWGMPAWTPHDLRRTAATNMEELGISPFIVGHVLNHATVTKATITSRVYAKYDYAKEKREALDTWATRLAELRKI